MAEKCVIQPDLTFINEVISQGGESLKRCYQCSTCSVVCQLSPDDAPFPRKEMMWAQWGLKERIFSRPDIWLCHQCNDCTVYCPRGAKPGNVLSALRNLFIGYYALPRFLHRMVHDKNHIGTIFAIPVVILGLVILLLHSVGLLNQHPGELQYANMMPHLALNTLFTFLTFLVTLVFALSIFRYWTAMARSAGLSCSVSMDSLTRSLWPAAREILTHTRFGLCDTTRSRFSAHLMVMYGFIGLLITTAAAVVSIVFFDYYPFRMTNFFKILGNVSALSMFIGCAVMIYDRLAGKQNDKVGAGRYFDWLFLLVVALVVITGTACQFLRLANQPMYAYPTYFFHLVVVFFLLVYAPYTKFAHVVYRTVAIIFSQYAMIEKNKAGNACPNEA